MLGCSREALFADTPSGARFCLVTRPVGTVKGVVLFAPPFAEELNKSRRMVALAARAFAAEGWAVLQIDLLGCGDSAGDFGQASWQAWIDDLAFGWRFLRERCGRDLPGLVWSLRCGGLLVSDWLAESGLAPHLLMWQPVTNGKQHLTQFLRLSVASEMLSDGDARTAMKRIRSRLEQAESVEVAGYEVSPRLASAMDAASLSVPAGYGGRVAVMEMSTAEPVTISPATTTVAAKWAASGVKVESHAVRGVAFWQTQEIEVAPAVIESSVRFLRDLAP